MARQLSRFGVDLKGKILSSESLGTQIAMFILRVLFGGLIMYHGCRKILAFDEVYPWFPDPIGLGSSVSFVVVVAIEILFGLCIAVGFLTRLAVIPVLFTMAVAFFIAYSRFQFMDREVSFAYLLLSGVVFLAGSGRYSADRLYFKR